MHRQALARPLGAQVDTADQAAVVQERQDVVAVHAPFLRRVDLQAIAEIEQALGPRALPDQRIERRKQGAGRHPPRYPWLTEGIGRLAPTFHPHRQKLAGLHQFGEARTTLRRAQPVVVAQVFFGGHAESRGGHAQQFALGVVFRRFGAGQQFRREHPFRQIVEPLETAPPGHRHLTRGEQPFQRMFFRAPVPPRTGPLLPRAQAAGTQRALFAHRLQHLADQWLLLPAETRQLLVDALAVGGLAHPPAQQWIVCQRQQRGFMAPVFEQLAVTANTPGRLVEQRHRIGTETGEQRQVVRTHQRIHRVDLQQTEAREHLAQVAPLHAAARPPTVEALRRQGQAAGFGEGKRKTHGAPLSKKETASLARLRHRASPARRCGSLNADATDHPRNDARLPGRCPPGSDPGPSAPRRSASAIPDARGPVAASAANGATTTAQPARRDGLQRGSDCRNNPVDLSSSCPPFGIGTVSRRA